MRAVFSFPVAIGVLSILGLVACGARPTESAAPSIATLADDPILLSRVLERCNSAPTAMSSQECTNARAAADRRFADDEKARARKAEAGFEAAREARRRAEAAAAQSRESLQKRMDPYELPVEGADKPDSFARP